MICEACKDQIHKSCNGCGCQHRPAAKPPPQIIILDDPIRSAEEFGEM